MRKKQPKQIMYTPLKQKEKNYSNSSLMKNNCIDKKESKTEEGKQVDPERLKSESNLLSNNDYLETVSSLGIKSDKNNIQITEDETVISQKSKLMKHVSIPKPNVKINQVRKENKQFTNKIKPNDEVYK